ncbi:MULTISPECIES: lipid A deacylase LpxR family protein [unclassified Mucilaginibacter]|uniref:lipid A deacylase LpxR family protein n=1 Tax=unclassified Mucilaginibacter TaxID=2617802 RepID=UPI002AC8BB83|nr:MULTISPECIES: lipid A deacylase LpxR family protein [unclassified Mucilaginibacter]MEB0261482.1 lipid A deacylase LpxR family protein [Mucilaginibacter sp. 10I4]MEB0276932.1 lipid A deacylase LpxR family protein [Mucilaginibacter sp. 10B2]MEB0300748.1 lipid A deacylase LpxR family protein [Mucilaginibacter sp. 5C4]WPX25032.1 lipid A deacylase LpxR family protein [Mucilaginibacter sp. 5C4]
MKNKLFLIAVCLLAGISTYAQTRGHEIGFQADNDSFLGQGSDRYYTNGFFLYYRHAADVKRLKPNMANAVFGLELGQKIYNAQSGQLPSADFVDRPVAGYLYLGLSGNVLYKNETTVKLSAKIGMVGPAAGGYPIQKFIHNTFGFYELNTWQYQVRNAAQVNLSLEVNKLLARASWVDVTAAGYINAGTGFNAAGIGPMFRLGNFNQLFNSVSTQSTASKNTSNTLLHNQELFFYYKPQINGILYDATVQGNIFKDHPEPGTQEIVGDINHFVFSNQLGVAFTTSRLVFDIGAVVNTREVKQQVKNTHQWGSITALYRFN